MSQRADRRANTLGVSGALALTLLAGCPRQSDGVCDEDVECESGEVCARGDHLCVLPSQVRAVRAEWTINGEAANVGTCGGNLDLRIQFLSDQFEDDFGFSPVPCETGVFSIDKLPVRYRSVELGIEGSGLSDRASFDEAGTALLNLTF